MLCALRGGFGFGFYHGMSLPICVWICMNCAKTPRVKLPPTITTRSQMFSWASGQW